MADQKDAKDKPAATLYCAECGHWVRPDTRQAASMLAGTVIVVQRCPGCFALLRAGDSGLISSPR